MADSGDVTTACLDLMRRLPPKDIEKNLGGLLNLVPEATDELLQRIDQVGTPEARAIYIRAPDTDIGHCRLLAVPRLGCPLPAYNASVEISLSRGSPALWWGGSNLFLFRCTIDQQSIASLRQSELVLLYKMNRPCGKTTEPGQQAPYFRKGTNSRITAPAFLF